MTVIARLAPSPTGALHIGNARSFLIAWLSARSQGGRVILRIEDIDSPRVKPESAKQILEDFRWLGLDWDEGPYYQTLRVFPVHLPVFEELKRRELVYPCVCTRGDIERAASAPHLEHEGPVYPGTCRGRAVADADSIAGPYAWRLRSDDVAETWDDGFRGPQSLSTGGDFVVWKSPATSGKFDRGMPSYQLAVVIDDHAGDMTEVVRGDDLIPSTPRQLRLFRLLGWTPPRYFHVPLVVGPDGRRLAKRHGDTRLATFRAAGVSAERLLGWLAASCGWLPLGRDISLRDLVPLFGWDAIPRDPIVFHDTID